MADFPAAARAWAASRASKETRAAYARDLGLWLAHCAAAGADPASPPAEVVIAFRDQLQAERAPLSVRRTLACLSACYVAVLPGAVNPFAEKRLPRPPASSYSRTEAVSDEDARRVIAAAGARGKAPLRDVALLWILWSTGMRRISAASIRRDGLTHRRCDPCAGPSCASCGGTAQITVVRHVLKGGEEVESELPPEAAQAITAWLQVAPPSRWLLCTRDGRRPMCPQAITKTVATAARAAGVRVHPHQFRSALITRALDAGIALERVRAAVHHKDIRSTLRYDRGQRGAGVTAEVAAFRRQDR